MDRLPNRSERDPVADLFKFADTFNPMSIGTADNFDTNPPFLRLDTTAQGLFIEWYTDFMTTRRAREAAGDDPLALSAHFGKYPGLLGKLALAIHIADCPTEGNISERTLLKALAWLDCLPPMPAESTMEPTRQMPMRPGCCRLGLRRGGFKIPSKPATCPAAVGTGWVARSM